MTKLFLSHSAKDKVAAEAVANRLEGWGYQPFVDFDSKNGVLAGSSWEVEILTAIRESVAVIVLFTDNVHQNLWCFGEVLISRYERKPVIPLLVEGSLESIWPFLRNSVQVIDLANDPQAGYERLRIALSRLTPTNETDHKGARFLGPPYAGLEPLNETQSAIYFGRSESVRAAISRLLPRFLQEGPRMLTVTGPSGSGKSSLVSAALVPSLRKGAVAGSDEWIYLSISPGRFPTRSFAEEVRRQYPDVGTTRDLTTALENDVEALSFLLSDLLTASGKECVCVVLDQLEELITVSDELSALSLMNGLQRAAHDLGAGRFLIVASARIDQLGELLGRFELSHALLADPLMLTALSKSELVEVVTGPAAVVGWSVDRSLLERIVEDCVDVRDPLPLLSYVLRSIFEGASQPGNLSLYDYERSGGLTGALASRAEELLTDLSDSERQTVTAEIVRALITFSADGSLAKRPALRSDVAPDCHLAFDSLVSARLLVTNADDLGRPVYEISHEALFRHWPRLVSAISEADAGTRNARRSLQAATANWNTRRLLPRTHDAMAILDASDRIQFDVDEIELLLRWSLANLTPTSAMSQALLDNPAQGLELVRRIVIDDDGLAQCGLLTLASELSIDTLISAQAVAIDLIDSPVEAVRRRAGRALGRSISTFSLVNVPTGSYAVGKPADAFIATVGEYAISRYQVTNLEFAEFVDATARKPWPVHWPLVDDSAVTSVAQIADLPVVYVNYYDAAAYCEYRSSDRSLVRLPTEVEWEISFTQSSSPENLVDHPWGTEFDPSRCNTSEEGTGRPTPIGFYSPKGGDTATGITDLVGNVWEWTSSKGRDRDGNAVLISDVDGLPDEHGAGWAPRVQRGGTFLADRSFANRTFRLINLPELALQDFGFRVVVCRR